MEKLSTDLGTTADYIAWLADAVDAARRAETETDRIVVALRAKGATWESIGEVLGMTKQGAAQKYAWIQFLPAEYREP